jgi:hypothetical protein
MNVARIVLISTAFMQCLASYASAGFFSDYDDSKLSNFKTQISLVMSQAPASERERALGEAAIINYDIANNCHNIRPGATYYLNQCYGAYDYTSNALAETSLYWAKEVLKTGDIDHARSALRNVITTYSVGKFHSVAKEAEFLLQDLEQKTTHNVHTEDKETLQLKLELEKTKLELERLKSQHP